MTSPDPLADTTTVDPSLIDPSLDEHADDYPEPTPAERNAILTLTALLAAGAPRSQVNAKALQLLGALGIPAPAILAAVRLAADGRAHGVDRRIALRAALRDPAGRSATADAIAGEPSMRARYLLNAAKRLGDAIAGDGTTGLADRFGAAIRSEQNYLAQHTTAQTRRLAAAAGVDGAASNYGETLGWYTVVDQRTTADCLELDGTNFSSTSEPAGGWPGARHGGTCRCSAGPAHDLGVGDVTADPQAQAA